MDKGELQRYLGERYRAYLEGSHDADWLASYRLFCQRTEQLASNLEGEGREALSRAFERAHLAGDLDEYARQVWYERDNGVSSLKQGGLSRPAFEQMRSDDEFWRVTSRIVALARPPRAADPAPIYTEAVSWMERFAKSTGISRFPAAVNRCFAGCLPGVTTSIVAHDHFYALLAQLEAAHLPELQGSWLRGNLELVALLRSWLAGRSLSGDDEYRRSIFFWWLYVNVASGYEDQQVIFYGSPGTGKTWRAAKMAESRVRMWRQEHAADGKEETTSVRFHPSLELEGLVRIVQFHPSFGYEEFVEGIRPARPTGSAGGEIRLGLSDGIFKEMCRKAGRWEIDYLRATDVHLSTETTVGEVRSLQLPRQDIWSFMLERIGDSEKVIDHLPPYVLVIDEINRAELSRVLGELMFSLEYRGTRHRIKTQYSSLVGGEGDPGEFLFYKGENWFFVPHNVFLFGTMNTIDRSVESFDFALRRRFRWVRVEPDVAVARELMRGNDSATIEKAVIGLARLNQAIQDDPYLGSEYRVGHAYMNHLSDYSGPGGASQRLKYLWMGRLEPLIREYLRGMGRQKLIEERLEKLMKAFLGV